MFKKVLTERIIVCLILIVIFIATTWLFYYQAKERFASDLALHISAALYSNEGDYTITKPIYRFIYNHCWQANGISVFLSINIIATIVATKYFLSYLIKGKEDKNLLIWLFAILLNFIIAIYIPFIHTYWNAGVQEANEWHNSTYICMKLIGMIAVMVYFSMDKEYLQKISFWKYIVFCILLTVANAIKPNFILAFAPTMLVFLIVDFIRNIKDKHAIRNMFIFGSAVLISLSVLLYQSKVLYGGDTGAGVTVGFMTLLKAYHPYPIISLIQSAAFPLFVLATNFKTIIKDRKYLFILIINIVALLEYLFLEETGVRKMDGNFDWGYSFTLMLAFTSSIAVLMNNEKRRKMAYWIAAYGLLAAHIVCGIIYFVRLMMGFSY